ncbi:hypothetical protein EDD76_11257 [Kineothrix alysoides]|uniref:Uncharacterized protein n=1 Tax=Kineothrix alysoides TaxID=1469948 RepID=A0A4R1QXS7_9FIRM|nr:hypothetical protein EDD76_11257 [Kineothrix alysoides]
MRVRSKNCTAEIFGCESVQITLLSLDVINYRSYNNKQNIVLLIIYHERKEGK